jgi:hypothetical protein
VQRAAGGGEGLPSPQGFRRRRNRRRRNRRRRNRRRRNRRRNRRRRLRNLRRYRTPRPPRSHCVACGAEARAHQPPLETPHNPPHREAPARP